MQKDLIQKQWEVVDEKKLVKKFSFEDFTAALVFVNKVAELAEDMGHHPDIHIVSYNTVILELSTHETGGISDKDYVLAEKIEALSVV